MDPDAINDSLEQILRRYGQSFASKAYSEESTEEDDLMLVFGLTQAVKIENRQYWGRELGMCWQLLATELFKKTHREFSGPIVEGRDQLCDLVISRDAVDTKYRIGSGDSGTLKKFRDNSARLYDAGYRPVLLILRTDSLPQAITSCVNGRWTVLQGQESFQYILDATGFDFHAWLLARRNAFIVVR
jgi:hypothetical protein